MILGDWDITPDVVWETPHAGSPSVAIPLADSTIFGDRLREIRFDASTSGANWAIPNISAVCAVVSRWPSLWRRKTSPALA